MFFDALYKKIRIAPKTYFCLSGKGGEIMNKKKFMALLLTLVMAVTLLAGCGGGSGSEDSTGASGEG